MASQPFPENDAPALNAATGNLYFDFDRNADDSTDQRGRSSPGLRTQLRELRRRHSDELFPHTPADADHLALFQESFFPHGLSQQYLVSNLSFVPKQPRLCIRPSIIGPRLEQLLPRGLTLAVIAEPWDHRTDPNNPVLAVQQVVDLSHCDVRPFEREVASFVFCDPNAVYPRFQRQQNIITADFVASLPPISVQTKARLQDWLAYLDWKERLIQANLVGLRYVQVDLEADGRYRFLVVAESKEAFERVRRKFRNDELRAFGLGYSQDPWEFQYNEKHRGRDTELGDFAGYDELNAMPDADTEGMPWDRPFCAHVFFRLSEDAQNDFDSMVEDGGTLDDNRAHFRALLPSSGFLALSVVGDISLVRRQRRDLELLQRQSGYAPLLSSYLFDITAAKPPAALADIADNQWFRRDLNEDQKLAVRKMISTPDLAMVQGPPGTGKTTMIAEAIWQFVRQGKKVLVVSQANLAVDNALERLAQAPAVRAIRLGRKGEKDHPFSQSRVLGTYYDSIVQSFRQRTLDTWHQVDHRCAVLKKWLEDVDLLASDIQALRLKEAGVSEDLTAVQGELTSWANQTKHVHDVARLRNDASAFLLCLEQDREWSGQLPESFLRTFFDAVVRPLQQLLGAGIRLNRVWPDYRVAGENS